MSFFCRLLDWLFYVLWPLERASTKHQNSVLIKKNIVLTKTALFVDLVLTIFSHHSVKHKTKSSRKSCIKQFSFLTVDFFRFDISLVTVQVCFVYVRVLEITKFSASEKMQM